MSNGPSVHLVDDDDAIRDALAELFAADDLPTQTYASAASFLASLPAGQGNCLVTDVEMPGMSGLELLTQLRALGSTLPAIAISGALDPGLEEEALRRGANYFFRKPVNDDALLDAVRSLMGDIRR